MNPIARKFLLLAALASEGLTLYVAHAIGNAWEQGPLPARFWSAMILGTTIFFSPFWAPAIIPASRPRLLLLARRASGIGLLLIAALFLLSLIKEGPNLYRTTIFVLAVSALTVLLIPEYKRADSKI
jgi:hypothetical protein